jgi:dynein intermediate chain 1
LCDQATTKRAKALHVAFNYIDPIVLVGDERGGVISFKLSNSLQQGPVEPEEDSGKTVKDMEIAKMDKFLDSQDKEAY